MLYRNGLGVADLDRSRAIVFCGLKGLHLDMTKLLQKALEAVRKLSPDGQDEIARAMLTLAGSDEIPEAIDPAHLPDVLQSLAEARRRQFASDEDVEAAFRRFDA
jgi:hypothetical protein